MPGWKAAEAWARLKAGVDCPMCDDIHLKVNPFSLLIAELSRSYAQLVRNQSRRGWTIVALKRHATELFELSPAEHAAFWGDVARVARVLDEVYQPVKLNYAVLGNLTPHIHCHLVPQFPEDDPRAPLNMNQHEHLLSDAEYATLLHRLRVRLRAIEGL